MHPSDWRANTAWPWCLVAHQIDDKHRAIILALLAGRWLAGRPGTRVALVAESGHDIHLDRPEALARIVIDVLREAITA